MLKRSIIIIGGGGHAAVVLEALNSLGTFDVVGMISSDFGVKQVLGVPVLGDDSMLTQLRADGIAAAALGLGSNALRERIANLLVEHGFDLPTIVHPSALVSPSAFIDGGAVILPRACIGTRTKVGKCAVVNTGAIADHDNEVGAYAHIAPGAAMCGNVKVGARAMVGVGASVRPGTLIGHDAVVGAGSAVVSDVPPYTVVGGTPARPLRSTRAPT